MFSVLVLTPAWDTDNKKNNSAEVTIVVVCNVSKPMHEIIASTPEIWSVNFALLSAIFPQIIDDKRAAIASAPI